MDSKSADLFVFVLKTVYFNISRHMSPTLVILLVFWFFFLSSETSYSAMSAYRLNKHKPMVLNCSLEENIRGNIYCEKQ